MRALEALLREIEETVQALDRDEPVGQERVAELSERVLSAAPALPRERRPELLSAWDRLARAAEAARDRVAEKLREIGGKRRAMASFGHLRGGGRGQQLNRRG